VTPLVVQYNGWTHGRLRSFARLKPIGEGQWSWRQEIVHFIVEENSRSTADAARAKTEINTWLTNILKNK